MGEGLTRRSERPTVRKGPGWLARVYWHRVYALLQSPRWWIQTALVVGFWVAVGWPVYQVSVRRGLLHTALALLLVFGKAWRQAAPRTMQLVAGQYLERKLGFYRLLREMRRPPPTAPHEVHRFQADALRLIASYVRSHRADARGTEIFVNLLVPQGDELVVVARNEEHRRPRARYPRSALFAAEALEGGMTVLTGNITQEDPAARGKPYRRVLCIPVHGDAGVLGVVTIDSTRRHHCDLEADELVRYLLPYVALLGWTLEGPLATLSLASSGEGASHGK